MDKKDIRKKLGLSSESFNFYVQMGKIWKLKNKKDEWDYDKKLEDQILEKNTVYKYYFNDGWKDSIKSFKQQIMHTGKVKVYSKEEIEKYQRKKEEKNENKKKS